MGAACQPVNRSDRESGISMDPQLLPVTMLIDIDARGHDRPAQAPSTYPDQHETYAALAPRRDDLQRAARRATSAPEAPRPGHRRCGRVPIDSPPARRGPFPRWRTAPSPPGDRVPTAHERSRQPAPRVRVSCHALASASRLAAALRIALARRLRERGVSRSFQLATASSTARCGRLPTPMKKAAAWSA